MFFNTKKILKIKNIIIIPIIFVMAFFILAQGAAAVTDDNYGLGKTANTAFDNNVPVTDEPATIIGKIVGSALAFVGILFLILMIYGGIVWMMARGNEQEVAKAKDLIVSAVIGLVIVLSAYAITAYIGGELTAEPTG